MGTLFVVLAVLAVIILIVVCAIRNVLSASVAPPAPPSRLQTEPLTRPMPMEELPNNNVPSTTAPTSDTQTEPLADSKPKNAPPIKAVDPSLMIDPNRPVSANQVAKAALKGWEVSKIPIVGVPLVLDHVLKGLRHTRFTGADAGFAHIPGATQRKKDDEVRTQIAVSASGVITIDGRKSTMAELEQRLADLTTTGGKVCYYSEPAEPKPPQVSQALGAILNLGIPCTFTDKPDGADAPS